MAPFIVLGCLSLTTVMLPLPQGMERNRPYVFLGLLIGFGVLSMLGGVAVGFWLRRRNHRAWDDAFSVADVEATGYLVSGRQYHGDWKGKELHVYISRGPTVRIHMEAKSGTRFGVGRKGAISSAVGEMLDKEPVDVDGYGIEDLAIYGADAAWVKTFFTETGAATAVRDLMESEGRYEMRALELRPEGLVLTIRRPHLSLFEPEAARNWLNDLFALARIAETLVPPKERLEQTALEKKMGEGAVKRGGGGSMMIWVGCGTVFFIGMATAMVFVILNFFGSLN